MTPPELDVSRAPRGEILATQLVAAVVARDDRVERHYLEIKSDLDLTSKADIAKIAKYILGSANRLPDVAATAFEGYGVMVIGVSPGRAVGVPPIEVLEIDKIARRYLGAAGPHWDVVRVPVSGSSNEVLVIVVDPPRNGQQPFPCRKDGEGLVDGRIYIRADGETREAKGDEIDHLLQRGAAAALPEVALEVVIGGFAYAVEISDGRTVDEYVGKTVRRLLEALPQPEPERSERSYDLPPPLVTSLVPQMKAIAQLQASLVRTEPEGRTEAEYRASIAEWERDIHQRWSNAIDGLSGQYFEPISICVRNQTKTFLHDVELKIHLEGSVRGVDCISDDSFDASNLDLPDAPRAWGPIQRSVIPNALVAPYIADLPSFSGYSSSLSWRNSGSVEICVEVGDLRPREECIFDGDELILVIPNTPDVRTVKGAWQITARDHNEIYSGSIDVGVSDVVNLTNVMRHILELDT